MNKKSNRSSSKKKSSKAAFQTNSAINRGANNKRTQKAIETLENAKRRKGSMPDTHKTLVDRIAEEKPLRVIGRMALDAGARAVVGHSADILTQLIPAGYTLVSSKLVTDIEKPLAAKPPGGGFRPTSVQEYVHPPVQRNLVDNKTYYTKVEVREGEPSRMMKAAKKMYPSSNHDFWTTGSTYCADMIYQCHGINQTGFWRPYGGSSQGTTHAPTTWNQVNKFTITSKDMYKFIQQSLTTQEKTDADAMKSNEDLMFNIESATSKMVVRNASELTPCICTAYLLNCNTLNAESVYPVGLALDSSEFPSGYISTTTSKALNAYQNSTGVDTTQVTVENCARLGFTPQMSRKFNDGWDVVDVIKSPVMNPGDQWNFTFKQHFAHSTTYQKLNFLFGNSPDYNTGQYCAGDYEIVLQFQGAAGFANNVSSGAVGGIRFSTNSNPCMISCTQSRTIQYRFADSLGSTVRDSDRFVSDVVRELDTSPRVSGYFGGGNYEFRAVAMTQTESKEANAQGIGREMDDD